MPNLPFSAFPEQIFVQILDRVKLDSRCKMRQTCSTLDSLIENHGQRFAARTKTRLKLKLCVTYNEERCSFDFSIGTNIQYFNPTTEELLRRLNFTCFSLSIAGPSPQTVPQILDVIKCQGPRYIHDDMLYTFEDFKFLLIELKQKPDAGNISIVSEAVKKFDEEMLELLKPFREFNHRQEYCFEDMLKTIRASPDVGNLKQFTWWFQEDEGGYVDFPFNTTNTSDFPHEILFVYKNLNGYILRNADSDIDTPYIVRQMELPSNYAIIVKNFEKRNCQQCCQEVIHFLPKDAGCVFNFLKRILKLKGADAFFREEYLAASALERFKLIQNRWFNENYKVQERERVDPIDALCRLSGCY